jgi:hypothetical protein
VLGRAETKEGIEQVEERAPEAGEPEVKQAEEGRISAHSLHQDRLEVRRQRDRHGSQLPKECTDLSRDGDLSREIRVCGQPHLPFRSS